MREIDKITIRTRITQKERKRIQELIDAGKYLDIVDFLRNAVRDKLEESEIVEIRDLRRSKAKRLILDYYKRYNKEAFVSDVANDLGLDFDMAFDLTLDLIKEGRLNRSLPTR